MSSNKVHLSQIDTLIVGAAVDADILGAGASFFGEVITVAGYAHISGFAFSDVDSASPDGIIIEQGLSPADFPSGALSTTHTTISTHAITGGNITDNALQVQIVAPFARVVYVNGGAAQTTFRMYFAARSLRGL